MTADKKRRKARNLALPPIRVEENPIAKMGWGDVSHACETRLVRDPDGTPALLIDLTTAAPAKPQSVMFMTPRCLTRQ